MPQLELTELELAAVDLVEHTPAPGKHCARNAYRHLRKAWALDGVDLEMAAFRGITAEEEAATAIFHSLRRRKYRGTEKLNAWKHLHKNAVVPFCTAVAGVLAATEGTGIKSALYLDKSENPWRFRVQIAVEHLVPGQKYAYPEPPLHFTISKDNQPHDFSDKLDEIAKKKNLQSIKKYLDDRANMRNRLLYASQQGAPEVTSLGIFLTKQRQSVFMLVVIYLMIDPYQKKQLFVQQAFQAFLKMLNLLPGDITFE
jgi:hypothetical protein